MKLVTKEHENKLNKLPSFEKQLVDSYQRAKERQERILAKWSVFNKLIGRNPTKRRGGVPPNLIELSGVRDLYLELGQTTKQISEMELRIIELEASNNGNEVMIDILKRISEQLLLKPRLPQTVDSMQAELSQVKCDLGKEMKVAKKAKRWLMRLETHHPKTEKIGDFP
jgi:hypothetical protein